MMQTLPTTVTNSIATKLDINPVIDMGTNKKIEFPGNIGEVGSVSGFKQEMMLAVDCVVWVCEHQV